MEALGIIGIIIIGIILYVLFLIFGLIGKGLSELTDLASDGCSEGCGCIIWGIIIVVLIGALAGSGGF